MEGEFSLVVKAFLRKLNNMESTELFYPIYYWTYNNGEYNTFLIIFKNEDSSL
jgi:uncharacterized membrane protein